MSILKVDDKWSVVYDPKSNDSPKMWMRHGDRHYPFDERNAVVAMFYALKEANAALTQSRAEMAKLLAMNDAGYDTVTYRAVAAAEARGMRRAAELALQRKGDGNATLADPYDKGYLAACDACAAAILAATTKGAKA